MIQVQFPVYDYKIREEKGREMIFDPFRRQWLILTPEEWVRQHFLQYLVQTLRYPAALIGIEREFLLGDLKKRFDIAVFGRSGQPWMLVECKAMEVPLNEVVLHQVLRYNQKMNTSYLVITNGIYTRCFHLEGAAEEVGDMPGFAG